MLSGRRRGVTLKKEAETVNSEGVGFPDDYRWWFLFASF